MTGGGGMIRINARLNEQYEKRLKKIERSTGLSRTEIIKKGIDFYYNHLSASKKMPADIILNSKSVGSLELEKSASQNYKRDIFEG
jgi:hypothetical protein